MSAPQFPPSGDRTEDAIKTKAGYVEFVAFANAREGYFCGTCRAFCSLGGRDGYCMGLKVPVESFGCCNNWKLASDTKVRGANGVRLRVLR